VSDELWRMGIQTSIDDEALRAEMGRGMFDTTGTVNPFAEDSPIKKAAISEFPRQFFLVLRVVQLFRGLSSRMGIEFSTAEQWRPFAEAALRRAAIVGEEVAVRQGKYYGI
jgi:aarF domain-containing kinase